MPEKIRKKWERPFNWPPSTWEFTPGMQKASEILLWLLFILILVTIGCAAILWPVLLSKTFQYVFYGSPDEVRNSLLAVAALIGVPFLIWRTLIASKQTNISREGHYTALFTKAVEQLGADKVVKKRDFKPNFSLDASGFVAKDPNGNPIPLISESGEMSGEYVSYEVTATNYEVRLGAIYALERIAQDSHRDAWPIFLTLCSYVQNNAHPWGEEEANNKFAKRNDSDIREIFNVLDRYKGERDFDAPTQFQDIQLPSLHFLSGRFRLANFFNCSIAAVVIRAGITNVLFDKCSADSFDVRQAVLQAVAIRAGKFQNIVINDCSCEKIFVDTTSDRAMLLASDFRGGRIHIVAKHLIISESSFTDVAFGIEQVYGARNWDIRTSNFTHCTFVEVNFALSDLSESEFKFCKFKRCNFVKSLGLVKEDNEFLERFTDDNYSPGALFNEPAGDLHMQWSAWIAAHSEN